MLVVRSRCALGCAPHRLMLSASVALQPATWLPSRSDTDQVPTRPGELWPKLVMLHGPHAVLGRVAVALPAVRSASNRPAAHLHANEMGQASRVNEYNKLGLGGLIAQDQAVPACYTALVADNPTWRATRRQAADVTDRPWSADDLVCEFCVCEQGCSGESSVLYLTATPQPAEPSRAQEVRGRQRCHIT